MILDFAGETHVGRRRRHNEDAWLVMPDEQLFVVADGMGGHQCGEVASRIAVDSLRSFFLQTHPDSDNTWPHVAVDLESDVDDYNACRLVSAIQFAHRRILYEVRGDPDRLGMGTTVVALLLADDKAYVAHVGDSRCYYLTADGMLLQLTQDHTLVNDVRRRSPLLSPEQEEKLAGLQHVVVRALGGHENTDVQVDLSVVELTAGATFLLCSDGLTAELADGELAAELESAADAATVVETLVRQANAHGGRDNITAIVTRVQALGDEFTADDPAICVVGDEEPTDEVKSV